MFYLCYSACCHSVKISVITNNKLCNILLLNQNNNVFQNVFIDTLRRVSVTYKKTLFFIHTNNHPF